MANGYIRRIVVVRSRKCSHCGEQIERGTVMLGVSAPGYGKFPVNLAFCQPCLKEAFQGKPADPFQGAFDRPMAETF